MLGLDGTLSLFAGAVALGVVHGAEPGHGWPVAATYALDRERRWLHGFLASFLLGLGHLVSSLAVVAVFFLATDYFGVAELGWIRYVAGALLVGLGIREYRHGHSHNHGSAGSDHTDHGSHDHGDGGHSHGDGEQDHGGYGGDRHSHGHGERRHGHERRSDDRADCPSGPGDDIDSEGLWGIVGTAFVLGFAHEEEFEIIGLCLGSTYCLELMVAYAAAVVVALVALTLALVAGFERYGERVERYADHLPTVSAAVLVALGVGFIVGVV